MKSKPQNLRKTPDKPCAEGENCKSVEDKVTDTPEEPTETPEPEVPQEEEPQASTPPTNTIPPAALSLVVKTGDGKLYRKDAIINAPQPVVEWETQDTKGRVFLVIALDRACTDALFEFEHTGDSNRGLEFLQDGTYYICVFQEQSDGSKLAASNNGVKLGLDRTKPTIDGTTSSFLKAAGPIAPNIQDQHPVTVQWSQVSGPSTLSLSDSKSKTPTVSGTVDGAYELDVALTDSAGNSATKRISLIWDATAPVVTSFTLINQASDGFLNASELSLTTPILAITATGYDQITFSDFVVSTTTCNASVTYSQTALPEAAAVPLVDGSYVVCAALSDAAGNTAYGKSAALTRDTVIPVLTSLILQSPGNDGIITLGEEGSTAVSAALTGSGYTTADFSAFALDAALTCNDSVTYSLSAIPAINTLPAQDGDYAFCVRLRDAAGNTTYGKSPLLKRDIAPPEFTSLNGINEASNLALGTDELSGFSPLFALVASGHTTTHYTNLLLDSALTCDAGKSYSRTTIPVATDVPATDGNYAICVKLTDTYGNITYGKSQTIARDTVPPTFTILALTGDAADGYISAADSSSTAPFATLTASGYTTTAYTDLLLDTPPVICDGSQPHNLSTPPSLNGPASDGIYVACVKLMDTAGNITYGKSAQVTRDTVVPVFTSLTAINGASDFIINQFEYLSPLPMFSLTASGHTSAEYSAVSSSTILCDGSVSYNYPSVPAISDTPGTDDSYVVCVRLTDAAGNFAYGKSDVVARDVNPPVLTSINLANAAVDGFINDSEKAGTSALISISATGHTAAFYTLPLDDSGNITCDSSQSYSQTAIPGASAISIDGSYAVCVKITDPANNNVYGKSPVIVRDTVVPVVTSFVGANGASDGFISGAESTSGSALLAMTASGHQSIAYSSIVINTTACNSSVTYPNSGIPAINEMTADGSYVVCAKLNDAAGNIVYGKSQTIVRDSLGPVITSFTLANQAGDGYINDSEFGSALPIATMVATDFVTAQYSAIVSNSPPVTCDAAASYPNSAIPAINTAAVDGILALCVKLTDSSGNTTYGKSPAVVRDTIPPVFNSLLGANEAADGSISGAEQTSGLSAFTLDATGYATATYTPYQTSSVTCNSSLTYSQSTIPVISAMSSDGNYAICVRLVDAAGNAVYGKSQIISRNVVGPIITAFPLTYEASDGFIFASETGSVNPVASLSATNATSIFYSDILDDTTPLTCNGSITYGNTSIPLINAIAGDGTWALCAKAVDGSNNITYGKTLPIVRDSVPPVFTSLLAINEAADGYINDSEKSAATALFALSASGYNTAAYSDMLASTATCDGAQSYNNSVIPYASSLTADGPFILCVKLSDAGGNVTYGQSQVIERDIAAPAITSFVLSNEAADGYINSAESAAVNTLATLVATGYSAITYSAALNTGVHPTCDGSKTYSLPTVPAISSVSTSGVYAVCAKIVDAAGNTTYGRSPDVERDTAAPTLTSFNGANGALDGWVNGTEYLSPAVMLTLVATGYNAAQYTDPLSAPLTCDASKTYGNGVIPPISALPAVDGSYAVCVKLTDAAGNIAYGVSQTIQRDVAAPVISTFVAANEAADGYINASEAGANNAFAAIAASGHTSIMYTAVLNDATPVTCDSGKSYSNSTIPTIATVSSTEGPYALCARLNDAAGNTAYGKSSVVTKDTTAPVVNAGVDAAKGALFTTVATATGAASFSWTKFAGTGVIVFDTPTALNTNVSASADGTYTLRLTTTDLAGNSASDDMILTWDTVPPSFTSLVGINEAADGYINNAEKSSGLTMLQLSGSDYSLAQYTGVLASTAVCDGSQTYSTSTIPYVNDVPAVDGSYVVCVKLSDAVGNAAYGTSQVIVRDTALPVITSFTLANEAADGAISAGETTGNNYLATMTASGYISLNYTAALVTSAHPTCDSSKTYDQSTIPLSGSLPAEGTYAVCAKLMDDAGNITYGRTADIIYDTTAPVFTSMVGANAAFDGWINSTEYLSPSAMYTLNASGYTTATFTNPLATPVTCDGSKTYGNATMTAISALPGSDGSYAICVKLVDAAGNTTYGLSDSVQRDIAPPVVSSFVSASEAADGYINSSEAAAATAFATMSATGHNAVAYTAILNDSTPVACDGSKSYSNSSIPLISSIPATDAPYALCGRWTDSAGNTSYAKTNAVTKDTTAPVVNAGDDATHGSAFTTTASVSGAATYSWTKFAGSGSVSFGSASAMNTTVSVSADGSYTLRLTATDAAGNSASDDMILTWDTVPPVFTSLVGINEAADGSVNNSEKNSGLAMLQLNASGYTSTNYTGILASSSVCDASQTYSSSTIPYINTMTTDGSWVVCVKLVDGSGNTTYGQSQTITRDTSVPVISDFSLLNEALDGYINSVENSSPLSMATLTGSDYITLNYTAALNAATHPTCDGSKTYSLPSIPQINSISTAATYVVCAKLVDAAGNTTYGRSPDIVLDLTAPTFTSLVGANGAFDGYVNAAEYLSPLAMYTLTASGHATANYTDPLATPVTCDSNKTYGNASMTAISAIPGTDGNYAICVKLVDAAGNITYGLSATVVRDITAPTVASFASANVAADGYINAGEASSSTAFASMSASDYTTVNYTAILNDATPVTCDSGKSYGLSSIPLTSTIPSTDAPYALCGRWGDAAGNYTYAKTNVVTRDTVAPTVNAGVDVTVGSTFTTAASETGGATYAWTKTSGTGTISFGNPSALNTTVDASAATTYVLRLTVTDAAGNTNFDEMSLTWDNTVPTFTSLNGANGASDGYINISEAASASAMFTLTASGYTTAYYTAPLDDTTPVSCDASKTYSTTAVPTINLLNTDGKWAVCVKLEDSASNVTYGKSQAIIRDTVAPIDAGFTLTGVTADGYINYSERLDASPVGTANASDWTSVLFTSFIFSPTTCNSGQSYSSGTAPAPNSLGSTGTFVFCLRLVDAAGNISYATAPAIIRDITSPSFSSLSAINAASDLYVSASEILSPLPIYSLSASGYDAVAYSAVIPSSTTCDATVTYSNPTIPYISDIPGTDGSYVICVKLNDLAGNVTYGKSATVTRDTAPPSVTTFVLSNGASDGTINYSERTSAAVLVTLTQSGATTVNYTTALNDSTPITCDASKSYSNGSSPLINSIGSDGMYAVCADLIDAAGNHTYAKSPQVVRNTGGPTFTSMTLANEASDAYVNSSEYLLVSDLYTLNATNYSTATYTNVLASTVTCDVTQTYGNASMPKISDIPGADGAYAVCVKLVDAVGNIAYGKSATVNRDITPATFTSLVLSGTATDGYINDAEKNTAAAFVTLTASGHSSQLYSDPLADVPVITCNASVTYSTAAAPNVSTIPAADNVYVVCVRLVDVAGNFTYGKSAQVTKDTTPPAAVSLSGTPDAYSRFTSLNVTVSGGAEITGYKSAILNSYSASCSGASYSSYVAMATPITTTIASDTDKTLCVLGRDAAGNDQAAPTTHNWYLDTTPPAMTASINNTTDNTGINISWNAVTPDYGTYNYMLVRGVNTVTWTPTGGVNYSAGNVAAGQDIVYVGTNTSFYDTAVAVNGYYEYAVYTIDQVYWYSTTAKMVKAAFVPLPNRTGMNGPSATLHADENSRYGTSVDLSADGLTMVVGAPGTSFDASNSNPLISAGAAYVYTRASTSSSWTFDAKLVGFGTNGRKPYDYFGQAVAISGSTIAVGAYGQDFDASGSNLITNAGAVYVFIKSGGVWTPEQKIVPSGTNARMSSDYFGYAVDLQNDTLAVGAYIHDYDTSGANYSGDAGAAWVFNRAGGVWTQTQKLIGTGTNGRMSSDYFGRALSLSGTGLAIGAMYQDYDAAGANYLDASGAVFLFRWNGSSWNIEQKVIPTGTNGRSYSPYFGYSVSLDNQTLAVGGPDYTYGSSGTCCTGYYGNVWVFFETGSVWSQQARVHRPTSSDSDEYFGKSVAVLGDTLVIGSHNGYDANNANLVAGAGGLNIYTRSAGVWSYVKRVVATGTNARIAGDNFGNAIAIASNTIVGSTGISDRDATGTIKALDSGAAYTYEFQNPEWPQVDRTTINETGTRYLPAQQFGNAIAISSDGLKLFVGAPLDHTDANDQYPSSINSFSSSYYYGSVHYYTRADVNSPWVRQQKIIPTGTNARVNDMYFGATLDYDADTLVVGAYIDDYDANGTNSMTSAGSAYVFVESGGTYIQQQKLSATGTNGRSSYDYFGAAVEVSGDTIAVGAYGQEYDAGGSGAISDAGAVYIFNRSAGIWSFADKLVATGTNARQSSGYFGYSLSMVGNILIVGGHGQASDATGVNAWSEAGNVFVFRRSAGIWSLSQKIVEPSRSSQRYFGVSVSLSGTSLAIGSYGTSTDENNTNSVSSSGAAYVYIDSGSTFTLEKKFSAFGTNGRLTSDYFGIKVHINGDNLTVKASGHDYDVAGVNATTDSGAIFTFHRSGTTWYRGRKFVSGAEAMRNTNDHIGHESIWFNGSLITSVLGLDYEVGSGTSASENKGGVLTFSP